MRVGDIIADMDFIIFVENVFIIEALFLNDMIIFLNLLTSCRLKGKGI